MTNKLPQQPYAIGMVGLGVMGRDLVRLMRREELTYEFNHLFSATWGNHGQPDRWLLRHP